jgi:ligand-binding sensor domain-containing protein
MFKSVSLLLLRWLVFLFTPVLLFAQQNTIKQFTINEGLPSNEVYDVLEDSKGYIWLSTDRGVCRFDGYSFEKFTTQDGLKDNTVFSMHEDSLGKIWFLSYSPELCYYQNDRIHDYKFNDRIRKMNIGKSIKADFFTTGDTVFVYAPGRGYYWIAGDGRALFFEVAYGEKTANEASIISCQKTKEGVWEVQKNKQYVERDTSYINRMNSPRYVELINNMTFPWRVHDRFVKYADQKIRMWSNNLQLLFYQQDILVKQVRLKKKVTCITRDQKGRYWAALVDGGVGRYKSPMNAMEEEDHFFGNQTISAIEEDMEGGMWFSTINNGVYYLPPGLEFLLPLPKELPNFPVLDIARNTNKAVFISYSNGEIWKLTDKNEAQLLKKIEVGDMRKNYNPLVFLEKSNELVSGDEMKVRYLAASVELVKQLSVQRKFNYVADQIRPPIFSKAVVDEGWRVLCSNKLRFGTF